MAFEYNTGSYGGVNLPYAQHSREGNAAQWLVEFFQSLFKRNPNPAEIAVGTPYYVGADANISDVASGNAAIASLWQTETAGGYADTGIIPVPPAGTKNPPAADAASNSPPTSVGALMPAYSVFSPATPSQAFTPNGSYTQNGTALLWIGAALVAGYFYFRGKRF